MTRLKRDTFRKLTPAQQRASIAGGVAATEAKKKVYEEMKLQRQRKDLK